MDDEGITTFSAVVIAVIITAIVAGAIGWISAPISEVTRVTPAEVKENVKAGFIYVGPVGDFGWTFAHDRGRRIVDEKFDWLTTTTAESVSEAYVGGQIDIMFEDDADVVFTTSFGYMDPTIEAGERWPNKILYHASGFKQSKNVGSYFSDFYQLYYLNGLAAGALSQESDKVGYIMAHDTSEVVRHVDAFALGAREVNPDVEIKAILTGEWYDPPTVTTEAESLIGEGVSAIAFTQDSPAVIEKAQSHFEDTGERVYSFSHYTPMKNYGPDVVVSGQLVHWEKWYEPLLKAARKSVVENQQHWGLLKGGYVELGSDWDETINPKFRDELEAVTVEDPILGEINVYDLIMTRLEQFKSRAPYEPFTGPIRDTEGNLRLKPGERITTQELRWGMDWYVEGVIPPE